MKKGEKVAIACRAYLQLSKNWAPPEAMKFHYDSGRVVRFAERG